MKPDTYSESVAIADVSTHLPIERCITVCDVSAEKRCKTGLTIDPTLTPIEYKDFIVCYTDSTKRRFRSTVHYEPRLRPRTYSDACYVRPKTPESVFASMIDRKSAKSSEVKWFSSAVHFNKAIDVACSAVQSGGGSSFKVSGNNEESNGYYNDFDTNNNDKENISHHGSQASMRVQTKIPPHYTNPGEKILVLASENRNPVVMADLEEIGCDPISGGSYKMCWNGQTNPHCEGEISRTRIKIDSIANVRQM